MRKVLVAPISRCSICFAHKYFPSLLFEDFFLAFWPHLLTFVEEKGVSLAERESLRPLKPLHLKPCDVMSDCDCQMKTDTRPAGK